MYGVSADIALKPLIGQEVIQVCLGSGQIQIHFHKQTAIHIESRWELRDHAGGLVDEALDNSQTPSNSDTYRIHRLLGATAIGFSVDPPKSFTVRFDTGLSLIVYDDSDHYESFHVFTHGQPDIHV